jgi:nitrate reductase NapE component
VKLPWRSEELSSDCEASVMISSEMLYSISSITFVGGFVLMFWVLMWKYVFEPNPLVRDFFDLDRKPIHKDQKRK